MNAVRGRVSGGPSGAYSASPTSNLIWPVCLRKLRNVVLVKEMEALKVATIYPGEEQLWKNNNGINYLHNVLLGRSYTKVSDDSEPESYRYNVGSTASGCTFNNEHDYYENLVYGYT